MRIKIFVSYFMYGSLWAINSFKIDSWVKISYIFNGILHIYAAVTRLRLSYIDSNLGNIKSGCGSERLQQLTDWSFRGMLSWHFKYF